jgi:hypothetical protein
MIYNIVENQNTFVVRVIALAPFCSCSRSLCTHSIALLRVVFAFVSIQLRMCKRQRERRETEFLITRTAETRKTRKYNKVIQCDMIMRLRNNANV